VLKSRAVRGVFGPEREEVRGGQRKLQDVGPKLLKLCTERYEEDQKMWAYISIMFIVLHAGSKTMICCDMI
jgi:hypothetical protein